MNNNHIIFEYDKYLQEYKKKYGENTILMMQIGSFYEMCAIIEKDKKIGEFNIHEICDNVLNVVVGKKWYKCKNETTGENEQKPYYMGGFPIIAQEKYFTYLLENNYTIVVVDQVTEPPNPERKVTQILSPGIDIIYNKKQNNYLLSILIEKYNYKNKEIYNAGISAIDLSTGKNYLHNINKIDDNNYYIDEISRLITFYNPSEILFQTENINLTREEVINKWDISHNCYRINHYTNKNYKKPTYQNNILSKIFKFDNMLSYIENLNLHEKNCLRLSYIYLLTYIIDHKACIINNIENPIEHIENKYLVLTSNSIRQLNVINNYSYYKGKNESLLSICNKCLTCMGKREFTQRLMYPLLDYNEINNRYDKIEIFLKDDFYLNIRSNLSQIQDLEKIIRLMSLDMIEPYHIVSIYLSYEYVNKVINQIKCNNIQKYYDNYKNDVDSFLKFKKQLIETINIDNITNDSILNIQKSIFVKGYNKEIDDIDNLISIINNNIKLLSIKLSSFIEPQCDININHVIENKITLPVKIYQSKDLDESGLYITKKRADTIKKKLNNINNKKIKVKDKNGKVIYNINPKDITFKSKDSSSSFINIPILKELSDEKYKLHKKLSKLNKKLYDEFIKFIYNEYNIELKNINKMISDIDIASCSAKISIENNYNRPIIKNNSKSFIEINGLRHPIVERINKETEYVKNNIKLGYDIDGILLFGTNACGKSTLMKAVGLNIIMAQAGLYVSCSKLIYSPYTQIFTRILNNDNIFKSESTFAVEMKELKGIINRCNDKSLILGDELCSGTETTSAISIVYAGLKTISNKKSTFIFTSHLHQINKLNILNELKNLKVYHLQIKYSNGILIYDRVLQEGPGPSIYGITVCEALGLSSEFISLAKSIKNKIDNSSSEKRLSNYNNNIIIDKCSMPNCKNIAEETHHIKEQCFSDKNNMIDDHHKNIEHNLVPLCKNCHNDITYGNLIIEKYIITNKGKKLVYNYNNNKNNTKKKYKTDDINNILKYKKEYLTNKSNCKKILELNENIKISINTLNKIMNNNY